MRQMTFSDSGFEVHNKQTRRQRFLAEMDSTVPWQKLCRLIEPHYPKGKRGRPPIGTERMLRVYFLQVWFNLSDPAAEDALYDSAAMRAFVGIDLGREPAPDETTICKFRHLIESQALGEKLFAVVNKHLCARGIKVGTGTIMDATIIAAPSSTKNEDGKRDPEMHQTKKGNQWYFGLKAHIGVDSKTKIVHAVTATPANVHDSRVIEDILHGKETRVWGDSAYQGQREAIRKAAPQAQDFTHHRGSRASALSDEEVAKNRTKSRVRAYVEHPFRILKCVFGFRKVCYRGIAKNLNRLQVSFALVNIYTKRRQLLRNAAA
ncbi:MAG: IS5 family transposase [Nitrospirales bacterium]